MLRRFHVPPLPKGGCAVATAFSVIGAADRVEFCGMGARYVEKRRQSDDDEQGKRDCENRRAQYGVQPFHHVNPLFRFLLEKAFT